ncbi:hypothetical protein D3C85_1818880 [compost metagenome]
MLTQHLLNDFHIFIDEMAAGAVIGRPIHIGQPGRAVQQYAAFSMRLYKPFNPFLNRHIIRHP